MQDKVRDEDVERKRLEAMPPIAMNAEIRKGNEEAMAEEQHDLGGEEIWLRILIEKAFLDRSLQILREMTREADHQGIMAGLNVHNRVKQFKKNVRYERYPSDKYLAYLAGSIAPARPVELMVPWCITVPRYDSSSGPY